LLRIRKRLRAKVANAIKLRKEAEIMQQDQTTLLSRERGTLPDRYWNQLNGKSAIENWKEQREQILSELEEEDSDSFRIVSEVKIK
jgi:hypothetical protein